MTKVRKTLSGDVLLILNKDIQDKTTTFSEKIRDVLGDHQSSNTANNLADNSLG